MTKNYHSRKFNNRYRQLQSSGKATHRFSSKTSVFFKHSSREGLCKCWFLIKIQGDKYSVLALNSKFHLSLRPTQRKSERTCKKLEIIVLPHEFYCPMWTHLVSLKRGPIQVKFLQWTYVISRQTRLKGILVMSESHEQYRVSKSLCTKPEWLLTLLQPWDGTFW